MDKQTYAPQDFLNAEEICGYLLRNLEIQFQATGETMDRETAKRHFDARRSLIITKQLLLDEGERAHNAR